MKNFLVNLLIQNVAKNAFNGLFKGSQDPMKQQKKYLLGLLKRNKATQYAKKYNFNDIHSIEDYQNTVPVVTYDKLEPFINKHVQGDGDGVIVGQPNHFSTTSGSSGNPKYIPISARTFKFEKQFARANIYIIQKLEPKTFDGKILQITSKANEGISESSIIYGSATGQIEKSNPNVIKEKYVLDESTFEIEDFESRYYCILRQAVEQDISMIATANPSTLVLIASLLMKWENELIEDVFRGTIQKKFQSDQTKTILETLKPNPKLAHHLRSMIAQSEYKALLPQMIWPNLQTIVCWTGGNCAHFLKQLPEYYGAHVAIKDPGYLASEVRATIPLDLNQSTGLPTFNNNFFEFIAVEDIEKDDYPVYTLDSVEQGKQYYILITNDAGLYRYNINDIVEIEGTYESVPMFKFIQKGKGVTNLTGEKLYEQQVVKAVEICSLEQNLEINFYILFANQRKSGYELYVQCENLSPDNLENFAQMVDLELGKLNVEYQQKRASLRLNPLKVTLLKERSFEIYKKYKVEFDEVRDAQFKMNYLSDNPSDIAALHSNIRSSADEDEEADFEQSSSIE